MQNLAEISHPLFEFGKPIDFTNAVIVAGLFFLLSVAVALYTGLVASRMIMFFQTRYKAALWNFEMHEPLSNATNPHDLSMQLGKVAQPIIFELRALGHHDAGLAVGKIFKSYVDHAAHLLGVPHSLEKMPALPSDVTREV